MERNSRRSLGHTSAPLRSFRAGAANASSAFRQWSRWPQSMRGQAMIWFVGLMATMALVAVSVYSVGQVTSEKQKVVNATDAAAYSGGLVQARALNLIAYGNRAEIGNEVFLAQLVSFHSWLLYLETSVSTTRTIMWVLYVIPGLQGVAAAIDNILSTVEDILEEIEEFIDESPAVYPVATGLVEAYATGLNAASTAILNGAALSLAAKNAADTVLQQNVANQNGKADTAPQSIHGVQLGIVNVTAWNDAFARYTKNKQIHNSSDGRKTAADILLASRDEFSTERVGTSGLLRPFFGNYSFGFCPLIDFGMSRDGPTQLKDYERWEAQDTSEFYIKSGIKCDGATQPFGYGRATLAEEEDNGDMRTNPHRKAGYLAYNSNSRQHGDWSGVKELWDLERDTANGRPNKTEFMFHYAAAKQNTAIKSAETLGVFNQDSAAAHRGNTRLQSKAKSGELAAVSAAKVFFARPRNDSRDFTGRDLFRADAHKEVASLYSPYWQVRLSTPTNLGLLAAYGSRPDLAPFSTSGGI